VVIDEFAARFVFFYSGYVFARHAAAIEAFSERHVIAAIGAIAAWVAINGVTVWLGLDERPVISLSLGFLGAAAVIAVSAMLAKRNMASFVRWCGEQSLPIYLAFFLPMAAARVALTKSGLIGDAGTEAAIVTACAVAGALLIHRLAMPTRFRFLFERPDAFRLKPNLNLAVSR
jgi:peptidoglycan/LPS O-acetylase OafA/YrhL